MMPIAQMSTLLVYSCLNTTSGAIYKRVPAWLSSFAFKSIYRSPSPKSIILTESRSDLSCIRIFEVFKSLCITAFSWMYATAQMIAFMIYAVSKSESFWSFLILSFKNLSNYPQITYSIPMYSWLFIWTRCLTFTILGWSSWLSSWASWIAKYLIWVEYFSDFWICI